MIRPPSQREQSYIDTIDTHDSEKRALVDLHNIGKAIKYKRKAKGLTQSGLALLASVDHDRICRLENGKYRFISFEHIDKIARGLDMKMSELILSVENDSFMFRRP